MGTPFVTLLEPSRLEAYARGRPRSEQPAHIPKTFLDAMEVREAVFVREQGVPAEFEADEDDARSCHWVVYASVKRTVEPEERDGDDRVTRTRRSETRSTPIGTVRLVPFPHPPHPKDGGAYVDGRLLNAGAEAEAGSGAAAAAAGPAQVDGAGDHVGVVVEGLSAAEERRQAAALPFGADRPTTLHDGREPYVKLGRLAVVPEFRGQRIAKLLGTTALRWAREHPAYFDPSVSGLGFAQMGIERAEEIPRWNGLVCVHAQEQVVGAWEKMGFVVDEGMGRWLEEGIPHVGMFQRLEVEPERVEV